MLCRQWLVVGLISIVALGTTAARAKVLIGLAAPLTGNAAWAGGETVEGAEMAIADLNAAGGVLGEQIELVKADDYCDGDQAVAAAKKLVASGVVMVFGHQCSGAAIPASKVYAEAGILMISTFATNPKLTEQSFSNVFRIVGRDDIQGEIAAELLAERWRDQPMAILHDGEAYGKGLAEETKQGLNQRGVTEALFDQIVPGQVDYFDIVEKMRSNGIAVLYYGGYAPEAGLIIRQTRSAGYDLQLVSGDALGNEDFVLIAGAAAEGALMTLVPDPRRHPAAALLAGRLDRLGIPGFTAYAAVQTWTLAVENAGSFQTKAIAGALRGREFDTVLGRIGFDAKGDVTGYDTFVWYVWRDGKYVPLESGAAEE